MPSNGYGSGGSGGQGGSPQSPFAPTGGQNNQFGAMPTGNNGNGMVRDNRMPQNAPMGSGMQNGGAQGWMNDPARMGTSMQNMAQGGGMYGRSGAFGQNPNMGQGFGSGYSNMGLGFSNGMGAPRPQYGMQQSPQFGMGGMFGPQRMPMFGSLGGGMGLGGQGQMPYQNLDQLRAATGMAFGGGSNMGSTGATQQNTPQPSPNHRWVQGPDGGYWTDQQQGGGGFAALLNLARSQGGMPNMPQTLNPVASPSAMTSPGAMQAPTMARPNYEALAAALPQAPRVSPQNMAIPVMQRNY